MPLIRNSKFYVFDSVAILNQTEKLIYQQQFILNAYKSFKEKHGADFVQYRDELSRGINYMGLLYLEDNLDKIDQKLFKISKPFMVNGGGSEMVSVRRACARHSYKDGLCIEGLRYSYDGLANLLLLDGRIETMVAPSTKAPIYIETKGMANSSGREILGSRYELVYNKYHKNLND